MRKILCVDFLNLLYRSFYGLPHMRNSKNQHVGALFAFVKTMRKMFLDYKLDDIIVFCDSEDLIKKEIIPSYKAHREIMPEELQIIKQVVLKYLKSIHIPIVALSRYEADDLIVNYARIISDRKENELYILSSDKDLQVTLLLDNVYIVDSNKNELLDKKWLFKRYNCDDITKEKLLLYYALCGDVSDGISGIKGIGEKTALMLIKQYQSLDDLYSDDFIRMPGLTTRIKNIIIAGKEDAEKSLFLIKPLDILDEFFIDYTLLSWKSEYFILGNSLLKEYECNSLLYKRDVSIDKLIENDVVQNIEEEKVYTYAQDLFVTHIGQSYDDYVKIIAEISGASIIAIDTETLSGDPRKTKIVGFSLCTKSDSAWYIPLLVLGEQVPLYDLFISIFSHIDNSKLCVFHNALFDMHVLSVSNVVVPEQIFDTMLIAYIFKEPKIGLKELSFKFFNEKMYSFSQVMEFGVYKTFDQIELSKASKYAATDARQTFMVYHYFATLLKEERFESYNTLFNTIEMPLLNVLYKMEETGILCNRDILIAEEIKYVALIDILHERIRQIALEKDFLLNPLSTKQTSIFLYDILKLPTQSKKTDQVSLLAIEHLHEIVPLIILYRSLKSNIAHFTTGLLKYIESDQRIYTHYQQFSTQTGRITTINPNLQNIPRSDEVFTIRRAFYVHDNFHLVSLDYSQIELRVLAYFSQDELLMKLFSEEKDIHELTATMLFKKNSNEITKQERQIAKKVNFSVIYGQGAYNLSKDLRISLSEAKNYLKIFSETYPGIFKWMEQVVINAKVNGYVTTLYGLRRYIPELADENKHIFKSGKRIAVNTIIQGTAAEIMKKAMIGVHQYCKKVDCGKIVLQIHDELLIELKKDNSDVHINAIKLIMEHVIDDTISMKVNVKIDSHWN